MLMLAASPPQVEVESQVSPTQSTFTFLNPASENQALISERSNPIHLSLCSVFKYSKLCSSRASRRFSGFYTSLLWLQQVFQHDADTY